MARRSRSAAPVTLAGKISALLTPEHAARLKAQERLERAYRAGERIRARQLMRDAGKA